MLPSCQSDDDVISGLEKDAFNSRTVRDRREVTTLQNANSMSRSAFQETHFSSSPKLLSSQSFDEVISSLHETLLALEPCEIDGEILHNANSNSVSPFPAIMHY